MNNLKSAETAKQAILERIAQKLAANSDKTEICASRHSSSTHSSNANRSHTLKHSHGNVTHSNYRRH